MDAIQRLYVEIIGVKNPEHVEIVPFGTLGFQRHTQKALPERVVGLKKKYHSLLLKQVDAYELTCAQGNRLPTLSEFFGAIGIPGLEGTLDKEQQEVYEDSRTSGGEWTGNIAYLTEENLLLLAEGVAVDRPKIREITYTPYLMCARNGIAIQLPDTTHIAGFTVRDLADIDPAFSSYVFGKPFARLPQELQGARFYLPIRGRVSGVYTTMSVFGPSLGATHDAASMRGCRNL